MVTNDNNVLSIHYKAKLRIWSEIGHELHSAQVKFPAFHSAHEGFAVLKNEVDALWECVREKQNTQVMRREAVQVAAMAIRFLVDVCEQ